MLKEIILRASRPMIRSPVNAAVKLSICIELYGAVYLCSCLQRNK